MNLLALFLSILMAILGPLSALAQITYTPSANGGAGGTIEGQVPLTKVGKLNIQNGVATIKGYNIDVVGNLAGSATKQNVLSGVVLKTDVTVSGSHGKATGLAYFRSGPGLTAIDDPNAEETIDVKGGRVISGRIVSINRDQVDIDVHGSTQQVASVDITTIHSPKAFAFTMGLLSAVGTALGVGVSFTATSPKLVMTPTFAGPKAATVTSTHTATASPKESSAPTSAPATGTGMSMMTKIVLATVAVAGIATAIAVPVAVGCYEARLHHRHSVQQQQTLANYLYNVQQSRTASPSSPVSSNSSP